MYDDREGKDVSGHDKSLDVRKGLNPKASTAWATSEDIHWDGDDHSSDLSGNIIMFSSFK